MTKMKEFFQSINERFSKLGKKGSALLVIFSVIFLILIALGINKMISDSSPAPLDVVEKPTTSPPD
ncbi:MAG: hypothetical protein JW708_00330, partial [Vallitaleaceae bacterium]|nr:hypothetical protein [Vallitaleaceae bacterium]